MAPRQSYRGAIRAVIFDWAGTTVDHGCLAPVQVLRDLFTARGVPLTEPDARRDMGLLKKDQIRKILDLPHIHDSWRSRYDRTPAESDVENLFAEFTPRLLECIARYSDVIDGVAETVERLRDRGIRIGSTTGYTRAMLERLMPHAASQGYAPDCAITPDDVGAGRPYPWTIFENLVRLRVEPLAAVVKIGDTPSDIEEGLRAGVWTVGVARTGNAIGFSSENWSRLVSSERSRLLTVARAQLSKAGAHLVIDSATDCEAAIEQIESRIQSGEVP